MKAKIERMKTMKNYKMVESMLKQDFERAKGRHDFKEMRDNYELLRELWSTGELDAEEYCNEESRTTVHFFAEIRDRKVILPQNIKWCTQNYGKRVMYSLDDYGVKLVLQGLDNELIVDYFKEEAIITKYIILSEIIELDIETIEILELRNGDIVEICIDKEMIVISKA